MKQKKLFHQWRLNEFPKKTGRIFDKQNTETDIEPIGSESVDSQADTLPNPAYDKQDYKDEMEPIPPALRSHELIEATPVTLRSAEMQTVSDTRSAVEESLEEEETLEEKVTRLERENAALKEENEALKKTAVTDRLTGLHTRSYFEDQMTQAVDEALRYDEDFSLVLIDLDKFKGINDELGHQAGDTALRITGRIMREVFRPSDVKCRYGGEELVVILPKTSKYEALRAAERLRLTIEEKLKTELRKVYPDKADIVKKQLCTVSVGVSGFQNSEERTDESMEEIVASIISEADNALYKAKKRGRNQALVYKTETEERNLNEALVNAARIDDEAEKYAQEIAAKISESTPIPKNRGQMEKKVGKLLLFRRRRRPGKRRT